MGGRGGVEFGVGIGLRWAGSRLQRMEPRRQLLCWRNWWGFGMFKVGHQVLLQHQYFFPFGNQFESSFLIPSSSLSLHSNVIPLLHFLLDYNFPFRLSRSFGVDNNESCNEVSWEVGKSYFAMLVQKRKFLLGPTKFLEIGILIHLSPNQERQKKLDRQTER